MVHGLTRVRGLTQDDAHIYCTKEQMPGELKFLLGFVLDLLRDYGLDDFYLELSTRDDSPKFIGADEDWAEATEALRSGRGRVRSRAGARTRAARRSTARRSRCRPRTRSAGPGRCRPSRSTSTSRQRFGLEYQAADGTRQQPVMIHRALFGSIERFFGVLTEHYAGAFPAWLAPVQVVGIPIREDHAPYLDVLCGASARARASGPRWTTPTTGCRRRSAPRSSRRSRSWRSPATRTWPTARSRSATATARSATACPLDEAVAHVVEVVRSRTNVGPSAP